MEVGDSCGRKAESKRGKGRMSRRDMSELVSAFAPLVKSLARRYEGRGAEAEDLCQEGYMELLRIARSVGRRQLLKAVSLRLPARVRDAATRMRRPDWSVPMPDDGDDFSGGAPYEAADGRAEAEFDEAEFFCVLDGAVGDGDMKVAAALACGESKCGVARKMGVSRGTVERCVRRIAAALEGVLRSDAA